ncbi:MAG: putative protein RP789 [Paracidovorax wautersii]|uniref:Methyltransferase domain-containing protein n=1 Tax=Paracidovorax wautersii TaxID=1177982 RepID=A0A7V8FMB0_9BURK|nr:MAG: putative protein RP789 [Paracidovorax wautersii]
MSASAYLTDVDYPRHFHRETMPVWLASVMTALGRRALDLARPYVWLELGCGSGLNAVIAAAANPRGQFIGIDFNERAIAQAQALAAAAGIGNVRFHVMRFDGDASLLPLCDFIVCHGVYSWVAPAERQAIQRIVASRLKPAGLLYLAYMSQPGASAFAAAQRFMRLATARQAGDSAQRATAGLALLQRMAQGGAGYFVEHPAALREVERMAAQGNADYLAHELLNAHWDALHVADVMQDMDTADCDYAGSALPLDNIDAVSLPANTQPLLAELRQGGADTAQLETFKDIARNQNQRRDLYQRRGAHSQLTADEHRAALLAQRWRLLPAAAAQATAGSGSGELAFDTRIGPVRLPLAHAAPLLDALRQGPQSYAELAGLPAYARQPGFLNPLLQCLAWSGWVHALRTDGPVTASDDAQLQRLNALLADGLDIAHGPLQAVADIGSAVPRPAPAAR